MKIEKDHLIISKGTVSEAILLETVYPDFTEILKVLSKMKKHIIQVKEYDTNYFGFGIDSFDSNMFRQVSACPTSNPYLMRQVSCGIAETPGMQSLSSLPF